jgi:hypothetical protein
MNRDGNSKRGALDCEIKTEKGRMMDLRGCGCLIRLLKPSYMILDDCGPNIGCRWTNRGCGELVEYADLTL